jgi:hypothetical protein
MVTNKSYWLSAVKVFKVACAHFYSLVSHKAFGRELRVLLIWRAQGMQKLRRTCCGVVKVQKGRPASRSWVCILHLVISEMSSTAPTHHIIIPFYLSSRRFCFGAQKTLARILVNSCLILLVSQFLDVIMNLFSLPLRLKDF